jgi:hypothetical protein
MVSDSRGVTGAGDITGVSLFRKESQVPEGQV